MKIHQLLATVNSQKILENDLLLSKIILSKIKTYRHVHNNKLQKLNFLFVLNVKIFIRKFDKPSPVSFPWDASVFNHFLVILSFRLKLKSVKTGLGKWFMGSIWMYKALKNTPNEHLHQFL